MSATPRHRFVIVDDHPLVRGALRQVLEGVEDDVAVEEAGSLDEVIALLDRLPDVDLLLLDLSMPGVQGFSGLLYLRAQFPAVPVVVVSATEEPATIRKAIEFGAAGFIPKSVGTDTIRAAVKAVTGGGEWVPADIALGAGDDGDEDIVRRLETLTPQQLRVLMMLSEGLLNKQIAHALSVSEATVKAHVSAVLQKLGVESRTQAVIAAARIAGAPKASVAS